MILLAAVIGLLVDMFMNTPGLNFAAFTLIGYLRNPILHLSISEESYTELTELDSPSFTTHKVWLYILYLSLCVITHTSVLFLLESFSTKLFVNTLPYILGSTSVTLVTFLIFDSIGASRKKP